MNEHRLFEYIQRIEEGKYKSNLDGTEYYLELSGTDTQDPWIGISYNDVRNYWATPNSPNFEREGEMIVCNKRTGDLYYHRIKSDVSSLLVPSYNLELDSGSRAFKPPYPESMEQLLDKTLQLLKTADKI